MLGTALEGGAGFVHDLARRLRGRKGLDAWDGLSDEEVLAPLVHSGRREWAEGAPDPDVYLHIELFYEAVAAAVEARTGIPCAPMLRMHHEGHGRVVVLAGRLVVVSRSLRDVSRFGFESVEKIAEAGDRLVNAGAEMIARFPDAARHGT